MGAAALLGGSTWCLRAQISTVSDTTAPAGPTRVVGVHAIWFEGEGDEHRERIDQFLECLLVGSTLNHFWRGRARALPRGSWAVAAPTRQLRRDDVSGWLSEQIYTGRLPPPAPGETPLYLVFGGRPEIRIGACGRNGEGVVAGRRAGIALVNNGRKCWPTDDLLRTETQIAAHEIVETADRLLGANTCAGGGACQGRGQCDDHCDTFVGLACEGAPTGSYTGCDGGKVDGWVIQKFSRLGREPGRCDECWTCDFTPQICPPEQPRCGLQPGAEP